MVGNSGTKAMLDADCTLMYLHTVCISVQYPTVEPNASVLLKIALKKVKKAGNADFFVEMYYPELDYAARWYISVPSACATVRVRTVFLSPSK
jgi:hypothetical protein